MKDDDLGMYIAIGGVIAIILLVGKSKASTSVTTTQSNLLTSNANPYGIATPSVNLPSGSGSVNADLGGSDFGDSTDTSW